MPQIFKHLIQLANDRKSDNQDFPVKCNEIHKNVNKLVFSVVLQNEKKMEEI
jgi:hypothetical protein